MKTSAPFLRRPDLIPAVLLLLAGPFSPAILGQSIYSTPYYFTTFAGSGIRGSDDGPAGSARFSYPCQIAIDAAGNVYLADGYNETIRKISSDGFVTTIAGKPGVRDFVDGPGSVARFRGPTGVALDRHGNLFVTEPGNGSLRKITPAGEVTTVSRQLKWPWGVTIDENDNAYVVDYGFHAVLKITPSGARTTVAGQMGNPGAADGIGQAAQFNKPASLAADANGNLFVADGGNAAIRKIAPDGTVTTIAGMLGSKGNVDANGSAARFESPAGLAFDPDGNLLIVDEGSHTLRKLTPAGDVTTLAGLAGKWSTANGAGPEARFDYPFGIALDAAGLIYITESDGDVVRRSVLPPAVALRPANQSVNPGARVELAAIATSELPFRYQWRLGGIELPGATNSTLVLSSVVPSHAGNYSVSVTSAAGTVTNDALTLTVRSDATASRLANISVRTLLPAGEIVTVGITTAGGPRDVLVRAIGPALVPLGVTSAVADPRLELFNGDMLVLANDDWPDTLAMTFASVGAFPLPVGGRDAAFRRDLNGAYTIQARGTGPGVVLVEAYAVGNGSTSRLVNLSARNRVGAGDDVLIAGFNISGNGPKQLVIRAVGPGLAIYGVPGHLSDPKLEIYDSTGARLAENDNWPASLAATLEQIGAFTLPSGSRDAALVTALMPGSYSVQVKGVDGATGEALVEIYEVR